MISSSLAAATMSTNDLDAAAAFYGDTLGIPVEMHPGIMMLNFDSGSRAVVYHKDDHMPAIHTVLTMMVPDVEAAVSELADKGVQTEVFELTDERGIASGDDMPPSCWIKDPAGNWICFTQGV